MLRIKDLLNRVYSGKKCIRFEVLIELRPDKAPVLVTFYRSEQDPKEWTARIYFERTRDKDSEVYNFGYVMPRDNLPLELIAATGLRYFQLHLKAEVQDKSNLEILLGELVRDM